MNYENDIMIDESALDVEWLDQPRLFLKYAKHLAECRRKLDIAKEELELVKAELDKDIRSNPDKYELSKITESVVQNTIVLQKRYIKAVQNLNDVKYEVDIALAAVRAFEQRKDALENLVKLHGQQYFAGPRVPRDITKEWETRQKQKRTDACISAKMKRKRKTDE